MEGLYFVYVDQTVDSYSQPVEPEIEVVPSHRCNPFDIVRTALVSVHSSPLAYAFPETLHGYVQHAALVVEQVHANYGLVHAINEARYIPVHVDVREKLSPLVRVELSGGCDELRHIERSQAIQYVARVKFSLERTAAYLRTAAAHFQRRYLLHKEFHRCHYYATSKIAMWAVVCKQSTVGFGVLHHLVTKLDEKTSLEVRIHGNVTGVIVFSREHL